MTPLDQLIIGDRSYDIVTIESKPGRVLLVTLATVPVIKAHQREHLLQLVRGADREPVRLQGLPLEPGLTVLRVSLVY